MAKKVIAFDMDNTIAESKSPITDEMSELLIRLLDRYYVCVISGGKYELFQRQLVANIDASDAQLKNLHLMPTCGTRYFRYEDGDWKLVYAEDISEEDKQNILKVLEDGAHELGMDKEPQTWGPLLEDRKSQISWSALGQEAPPKEKYAWDPDGSKKKELVDLIAPKIPEFEVRAGGTTTIDVTKLGIDKAYGMNKLMDALGVEKEDILFFGDKLQKGGNDYPVKAMGIDCIEVKNYTETPAEVRKLL